jgi:hypothetical protein
MPQKDCSVDRYHWNRSISMFHSGRSLWNERNNLLIHRMTFPNTTMTSCIKATTTCSTTKWTQKRKPCSCSCWNFYTLIDGDNWSSMVQQPASTVFLHPALACQEWTISGSVPETWLTNKVETVWEWWPYICNFSVLDFEKQNWLVNTW